MSQDLDRHPSHLWHETAAGEVRCAEQDCPAEPTELEAAQTLADAETKAGMVVELDWSAPSA